MNSGFLLFSNINREIYFSVKYYQGQSVSYKRLAKIANNKFSFVACSCCTPDEYSYQRDSYNMQLHQGYLPYYIRVYRIKGRKENL